MSLQEILVSRPDRVFAISDTPSGQKRKVWVTGFSVDDRTQTVVMTTTVVMVDAQGVAIENDKALRPYARMIYAINERKVNPANGYVCTPVFEQVESTDEQGNPITVNGQQTGWIDLIGNSVALNAVMGQYDYFDAMLYNPPPIPALYASIVAMCDIEGTFDTDPQL